MLFYLLNYTVLMYNLNVKINGCLYPPHTPWSEPVREQVLNRLNGMRVHSAAVGGDYEV